jgi:hypothetical protein
MVRRKVGRRHHPKGYYARKIRKGKGKITGVIYHGKSKIPVKISCRGKVTMTKGGHKKFNALKKHYKCKVRKTARKARAAPVKRKYTKRKTVRKAAPTKRRATKRKAPCGKRYRYHHGHCRKTSRKNSRYSGMKKYEGGYPVYAY